MPVGVRGELVEVVDRPALLGPAQLRLGDRGGEPVIALLAAGEHQQVAALGIGLAVLRLGQPERELGAEHGLHLRGLGRLGEAHDAVEAVVVGDREGVQAEPLRLFEQLFGGGRAVEEAVARVRVQLGVGQRVAGRARCCCGTYGPRLQRPGRAVAAVGVRAASAAGRRRSLSARSNSLHLMGGLLESHQRAPCPSEPAYAEDVS